MSRAFYVLIFLMTVNLVITIIGFVNQSSTSSQVVYVPAAADKSSPSTAAPAVPTIAVKLPDEKMLRDMIQAVLEQELEPYRGQLTTTSKVSATQTPQLTKTSPENVQAYNQAKNIVDNALAQGVWTSDLNQQLQSVSVQLTPEQHDEILKQLIIAINQQQLKITRGTFPTF